METYKYIQDITKMSKISIYYFINTSPIKSPLLLAWNKQDNKKQGATK